jgi:DNA-binding Xre family transcriptional regulator
LSISYRKLFYMLIDRGLKDVDLRKAAGISAPTMSKLRRDQIVQTDIIDKVCRALDCQPGDIMEFVKDESSN